MLRVVVRAGEYILTKNVRGGDMFGECMDIEALEQYIVNFEEVLCWKTFSIDCEAGLIRPAHNQSTREMGH